MTCKINCDTSDGLKLTSDTSGEIDLQIDASTKVHMASDGKVGIGTTSPTSMLQVNGDIRLDNGSNDSPQVILANPSHDDWYADNASGQLRFINGSTLRMILNSSGNVGIGTSSNLTGKINLPESDYGEGINIFSSGTEANRCGIGHYAYDTRIYYGGSDSLTFVDGGPSGTERMRIDSSGNLGIGTTGPQAALHVIDAGASPCVFDMTGTTGDIVLLRNNGSTKGTISTNGSTVSYNTSSDYRLKENVEYTFDATTRLKQLKPCRFNWIADDTNTLLDGFIAHEVSSIVPEAVTGTKDAMETYTDDDGEEQTREKYQGIDQSKLVPLLVKTIQELEARITALENN